MAVVSGLIGATLSLGLVASLVGIGRDTVVVERNVAIQPVTSVGSDSDTLAAVAARTAPAVVALRIEHDDGATSASAIVLRSDGHLLTNAHVVAGAESIDALLHGGTAAVARVVGVDPLTDVAVLRIDADDLQPAALGSADAVVVGDEAIAIGAAGTGAGSAEVTTGVIRALDRRLQMPDGTTLHEMILVDIVLDEGIAGGPLLDSAGAVVGVTSALPASTEREALHASTAGRGAVAVATPIDLARRIADQIIEHGRALHVWLGVEGSDLSSSESAEMGIAGGAAISRVVADSPAEAGGLLDGDVIVAVGSVHVGSMSDLISALRAHAPGDEVTVSVRRGEETLSTMVVLDEKQRA